MRESSWDLESAADRLRNPPPSIYDLIERSRSVRTAGDVGAEGIASCHSECVMATRSHGRAPPASKRTLARRIKELGLT